MQNKKHGALMRNFIRLSFMCIFIMVVVLLNSQNSEAVNCCSWDYPNGWHENYSYVSGA